MTEEEAAAQQAALLAAYGATPQDRERVGFPNFTYPPEDEPSQSFRRGTGYPGDWLAGLTGFRAAPLVAASDIPPALVTAPPARPTEQPMPSPPPRLAMPTQESHEPLPTVFSPQSLIGPPPIDERVNPPTTPEREGLEGAIAGRHWNIDDPVALMGMRRGAIDWTRGLSRDNFRTPGVDAEYVTPGAPEAWLRGQGGGRADTVRFRTPEQAVSRIRVRRGPGADPANPEYDMVLDPGTVGQPDFADVARHELRHRGFHNLRRLAGAYGINFPEALARSPYLTEGMNVYEDRRTGFTGGYEDMTFSPSGAAAAERDAEMARNIARQVNAERVRRLHAAPGATWSDIE